MKPIVSALLAIALSSCMPIPAAPAGPEVIRYETTQCFGVCPDYTLTVSSDLVGSYEGRNFVEVKGRRNFTFTADQWAAFKAALAPYRPDGELLMTPGEPACTGPVATDLPSVDIRWTGGAGENDHLLAYFGCDMDDNEAMFDALAKAPHALPIEQFLSPVE